jgi:cellulose synthase/poly-beta-1,6-N-acetylglucosamine synthase-like glycosyltransferase
VLILTKPNSGKADALNFGLEHLTDEELFVGIDADTVIAHDAISRLVPHFLNPKVGAVAGNAKVGNRSICGRAGRRLNTSPAKTSNAAL